MATLPSLERSRLVDVALVGVSAFAGYLVARSPLVLVAVAGLALGSWLLTHHFATTVIVLLVLRSSLDPFSGQNLTGALALLIDLVTVLTVFTQLILRRPVGGDWFLVFLGSWIALMGLWPVAMQLGLLGLGPDEALRGYPTMFEQGVREWVRVVSYGMIYALVMQLRDRIPPGRVVSLLLLSLVVPVTVAYLQAMVPGVLPPMLRVTQENRLTGTLGHADTFVTYLLLMVGLAWWKFREKRHWGWLVLIALLIPPYVGTKTLSGVAMMLVFIAALLLPRLNLRTLAVAGVATAVFVAAFASSPIGYERLQSLRETPVFNGEFDPHKASVVAYQDGNSFSWRIAQWTYLVKAWERSPLLGHGLQTTPALTPFGNDAHNDYVRALAETGTVGLALFFVLLGAIGARLVQIARTSPPTSSRRTLADVLLAVFAALLVGMFADHYWKTTTFWFYWWTAMAVVGWTWPSDNQPVVQEAASVPALPVSRP